MIPKVSSEKAKQIVKDFLKLNNKDGVIDLLLEPIYSAKFVETDGNVWLVRVVVEKIDNSSYGAMRDGYIDSSELTSAEITLYAVSETTSKVEFYLGSYGQRVAL